MQVSFPISKTQRVAIENAVSPDWLISENGSNYAENGEFLGIWFATAPSDDGQVALLPETPTISDAAIDVPSSPVPAPMVSPDGPRPLIPSHVHASGRGEPTMQAVQSSETAPVPVPHANSLPAASSGGTEMAATRSRTVALAENPVNHGDSRGSLQAKGGIHTPLAPAAAVSATGPVDEDRPQTPPKLPTIQDGRPALTEFAPQRAQIAPTPDFQPGDGPTTLFPEGRALDDHRTRPAIDKATPPETEATMSSRNRLGTVENVTNLARIMKSSLPEGHSAQLASTPSVALSDLHPQSRLQPPLPFMQTEQQGHAASAPEAVLPHLSAQHWAGQPARGIDSHPSTPLGGAGVTEPVPAGKIVSDTAEIDQMKGLSGPETILIRPAIGTNGSISPPLPPHASLSEATPHAVPIPEQSFHVLPSLPPEGDGALTLSHGASSDAPRHPIQTAILDEVQRLASTPSGGPVTLTLSPEELGTLRFVVQETEQGLYLHLTVDQPATLDLLRRQADLLLSDLRQFGFHNASLSFAGQEGQANGQGRNDTHTPASTPPRQEEVLLSEPSRVATPPAIPGTSLNLRL